MSDHLDSMMDAYEAERVYGPPPRTQQKSRTNAECEEGRIDFLELPTLRESLVGLSLAAVCLLVPAMLAWRRFHRNR